MHNSRVIKHNFLVGLMVSSVLEPVHGIHIKLNFLKELLSVPWFQKRLKIGRNTKRFSGEIRGRRRSSLQIFGENEFVRKRLPLPHSLRPPVLPSPFPSKPSTFGRASERASSSAIKACCLPAISAEGNEELTLSSVSYRVEITITD